MLYKLILGSRVNTGTFRVKKKPEKAAIFEKKAPPATSVTQRPRPTLSQESSEDTSSASIPESPSENEYNHLTDMVDVQVLARMQEDSESIRD